MLEPELVFLLIFSINNVKEYKEIIGIDLDEQVIESTRNNFKQGNIHFQKMNSEQLSFDNDSFDTVCISNSLHHLADINMTLQEMLRVLKPGGLFMFCDEQNEKQLIHVYLHHLRAEIETILGATHNNTFKKQELINIAQGLKLKDLVYFEYRNTWFDKNMKAGPMLQMYKGIVEKLKGHAKYSFYDEQLQKLSQRTYDIGIEFATLLMILGRK